MLTKETINDVTSLSDVICKTSKFLEKLRLQNANKIVLQFYSKIEKSGWKLAYPGERVNVKKWPVQYSLSLRKSIGNYIELQSDNSDISNMYSKIAPTVLWMFGILPIADDCIFIFGILLLILPNNWDDSKYSLCHYIMVNLTDGHIL